MKTIQELREELQSLTDRANEILQAADTESRALTEDERNGADDLLKQADVVKSEVGQRQSEIDIRARAASLNDHVDDSTRRAHDGSVRVDDEPNVIESRGNISVRDRSMPDYGGRIKGFANKRQAYAGGQWLRAVVTGDERARSWCRDNGMDMQSRALGLTNNTTAGYLVPEELSSALINLREERGIARRFANVLPLGTETVLIPRRTGGVTAYAMGDNPSTGVTASDPTVDQIELNARVWAALTQVSNSLMSAAVINVASWCADEFSYAFADREDEALFNGDGTSTHHGIFGITQKLMDGNHNAGLITTSAGELAFSDLTFAHFETAIGTLPRYAANGAAWFVSQFGFARAMQRLADTVGGMTFSDVGAGLGPSFLGFPVVITQVMTAATGDSANTVLVVLGNLRQGATLGDREGFSLQVLQERYAEFLQTGLMATTAWDIAVHVLGDNTNAGPIVGIETPAS